jgi:hypothetical protein
MSCATEALVGQIAFLSAFLLSEESELQKIRLNLTSVHQLQTIKQLKLEKTTYLIAGHNAALHSTSCVPKPDP